jgi:MerR family transcriptional regulator, thiopeptide resistance regulator
MISTMKGKPSVYTVNQLAKMAGVSTRTLHFYDEIGLLKPESLGKNRYRFYGEGAALRLQQILFYRELGFPLAKIRAALDQPGFDTVQALESHRQALSERTARLTRLIQTIDRTILNLKGKRKMDTQELFTGFDEETQKRYEDEAAALWGEQTVRESSRRWKKYPAEKRAAILAEAGGIYRELAKLMQRDPADREVQQLVAQWHQNMRYFYEPTPEILRNLGQAYCEHPGFRETFLKIHPDPAFPEFLRRAIERYCAGLPAGA